MNTEEIKNWLIQELEFLKEKNASLEAEYNRHRLSKSIRDELFWYSGRMDTVARLLKKMGEEDVG